jgi:predicted HAD superfamily Cof-like phosphohydrolase
MKTTYQNVKEFMSTFGQETPPAPIIPSLVVRKLRAKLILEEALETIKALGFELMISCPQKHAEYPELDTVIDIPLSELKFHFEELHEPNLVELLDGLCDIDYVGTAGTAIACGISEGQMIAAAEEVHRSNLSKLWTEEETNTKMQEGYSCTLINNPNSCSGTKIWLVKNKEGKVQKGPSFSPPNLKQILGKV